MVSNHYSLFIIIVSTAFVEDDTEKEEKKREKKRRKALQSSLVEDLADELSEAPREIKVSILNNELSKLQYSLGSD